MKRVQKTMASLLSSSKEDKQRKRLLDSDVESALKYTESASVAQDYQSITGYKFSIFGFLLYYALGIATGGLLFLFSFWYPNLGCVIKRRKSELSDADFVLIYGIDECYEEVSIQHIELSHPIAPFTSEQLRFFRYRNVRYIYYAQSNTFIRPEYDFKIPFTEMHELSCGITEAERDNRVQLYGQNLIDIPIKSIPAMLIGEVFHPFYIFQIMSSLLWFFDNYYYYASIIVVMSTASIIWTIIFTRRQLLRIQEMALVSCEVTVVRKDQEPKEIHSFDLVPGDIVLINEGMTIPCDIILLSGECVMNESSLTGESIPILKCSIPKTREVFSPTGHKKHTLFSGTEVLQISPAPETSQIYGMVCRTGFSTMKGDLFHSMLFPRPIKFSFYSESYQFLGIMLVIAIAAFGYSAWQLKHEGKSASEIALKSLDLITIAVPPALPVVLTIGIGFALDRLQHKDIFCISPPRINYAGKLDCYCFDKTGTLTEDNLEAYGAHSITDLRFDEKTDMAVVNDPLLSILASTHSISYVAGKFHGHPVDVEMFKATGWKFNQGSTNNLLANKALATVTSADGSRSVFILRRFEFEAALQRMSVIVTAPNAFPGEKATIFSKGSPEAIKAVCKPETIPDNFDSFLSQYTKEGFYVLGCAYKHLNSTETETITRHDVENEMHFAGLLVMENKLKPETPDVIEELLSAKIKVVIITGDNPFTTVHIARKCGLIDEKVPVYLSETTTSFINIDDSSDISLPGTPNKEFIITGKAIDLLLRDHKELVPKIRMFARTTPNQKSRIVECLMEAGYFVGMCGDGTNDCGALKAAHVGMALSDAEASVVAPFTSRKKTIADVVEMMKEGRCALVTSFIAFKYMIAYPIIQLLSAMWLYEYGATLGDFQYLMVDLVIVLPLAVTMCYTTAWHTLTKHRPPSTLWCFEVLISIFYQLGVHIALLFTVNLILINRDDYEPPEFSDELVVACQLNATTFLFSNFQYIISALAFSSAAPFRNNIVTNYLFTISLAATWGLCTYLMLAHPAKWIENILELFPLNREWRVELFGFMLLNLVLTWGFELLFIHNNGARCIKKAIAKCAKR